jgi:hypothetical protein
MRSRYCTGAVMALVKGAGTRCLAPAAVAVKGVAGAGVIPPPERNLAPVWPASRLLGAGIIGRM